MKLLYVATTGKESTSISPMREIDMLQRLFRVSLVEFSYISSIVVEDLPLELSHREFDILHIAAHGFGNSLVLATGTAGTVKATASLIARMFHPKRPPKLVYLNACDSDAIAEEFCKLDRMPVQYAIGTTDVVASFDAIYSARAFYGRLLLGLSLADAADVGDAMMRTLSRRVGLQLFCKQGSDPQHYIPLPEPEIVVALSHRYTRGDQVLEVIFGIRNMPSSTQQVVFFSADEDLSDLRSGETLGAQRTAVTRSGRSGKNASDIVWCEGTESWDVAGDFQLYAIGVTADGRRWTSSRQLSEGLKAWYDLKGNYGLARVDFDAALGVLAQ